MVYVVVCHSSKGFNKQAKQKSDELEHALKEISNFGEYPVLCDTSPCTKNAWEFWWKDENLWAYWVYFRCVKGESWFYSNGWTNNYSHNLFFKKNGLTWEVYRTSKNVFNKCNCSENVKCCGFAGDRGFNFPELNQSALRFLKDDVKEAKYAFSTSKTCEIGLSETSGLDYNSIFYLIDKCTISKNK